MAAAIEMATQRVNLAAVASAAALMTVIGALDGLVDEPITPVVVRAGWKTLLGAAGLYLNVTNFLSQHPGGELAILTFAGKDATEDCSL